MPGKAPLTYMASDSNGQSQGIPTSDKLNSSRRKLGCVWWCHKLGGRPGITWCHEGQEVNEIRKTPSVVLATYLLGVLSLLYDDKSNASLVSKNSSEKAEIASPVKEKRKEPSDTEPDTTSSDLAETKLLGEKRRKLSVEPDEF